MTKNEEVTSIVPTSDQRRRSPTSPAATKMADPSSTSNSTEVEVVVA